MEKAIISASPSAHRDRARAKRYATEEAAKLLQGESDLAAGKVTLAQVFALYLENRTPRKRPRQQKVDEWNAELWTRVLGGDMDPHAVTLHQWESFIDGRGSGAIDRRGNPVPDGKRKCVRARAVEIDCEWLRVVFNWAVCWRLPSGRYTMRENPVRGFSTPKEKNVRRPVAKPGYFQGIRKASERHTMEDSRREEAAQGAKLPARAPRYCGRNGSQDRRYLRAPLL